MKKILSSTITNYEMEQLRLLDNPRHTRWNHVWCSTSNEVHPISQEHFEQIMRERYGE